MAAPPPAYQAGPPSYQPGYGNTADIPVHCSAGHDLHIGLSWDFFAGMDPVDLDAQCILLNGQGTVVDAVYYNQTYALNGALIHSGDEQTGETQGEDEFIDVDLDQLDATVKFIVLVISCYSEGTFANVETARLELKDQAKSLHTMSIGTIGNSTSVIPGYLYFERNSNEWKFHSTRIKHSTGRNFQEIPSSIKEAVAQIAPWLADMPTLEYDKTFNMKKGDVVAIMTDALTFKFGLGWEAEGDIDLDGSCVMLDVNNRVLETIMYNNLYGTGVTHSGDNQTGAGKGDDEVITVRLQKVPRDCVQIVFTVNIYTSGASFARSVYDAYVRMMCGNPLKPVAYFPLSPDEGGNVNGQCLVFSRLYCTPGGWKFEALGIEATGSTAQSAETVRAVKSVPAPVGCCPALGWTPEQRHVDADNRTSWNSLRLPPPPITAGLGRGGNQDECCVIL